MTPAGQMDRRIAFERSTTSRSGLGTVSASSWAEIGERWAKVLFGTGAERREAATEGSTQAATFRVRADDLTTTITAKDRIAYAGRSWDITGIAPIGRGPAEIEFTATAAAG